MLSRKELAVLVIALPNIKPITTTAVAIINVFILFLGAFHVRILRKLIRLGHSQVAFANRSQAGSSRSAPHEAESFAAKPQPKPKAFRWC